MAQTTAMEFQRRFGAFQHQARREPVEIMRHGRRELVLMSADHYDWLVAAVRRTHRTAEAAAVVADAVRRAEMGAEQADKDTIGVEIPAKVREALGLDDAPSWEIISEHNVDEWPNGGLAPLPGRPGVFSYGFIPPGLFARVKSPVPGVV